MPLPVIGRSLACSNLVRKPFPLDGDPGIPGKALVFPDEKGFSLSSPGTLPGFWPHVEEPTAPAR